MLRSGSHWERQPDLQQAKLLTDDAANAELGVGPVIRRPDLLIRESGGEKLLYDPASGRAHWLNATAAVIWELIDGVASRVDLAASVADLFAVEPGEARAGVDVVVGELELQGLLGDARELAPDRRAAGTDHTGAVTDALVTEPRFLRVPPNL